MGLDLDKDRQNVCPDFLQSLSADNKSYHSKERINPVNLSAFQLEACIFNQNGKQCGS